MRKFLIASLIMAIALADVCAAQSSTEATRWLIPNQGEERYFGPFRAVGVTVYNMGLEETRAVVLPFKGGRALPLPAPASVVQPGSIVNAVLSVPFDFLLVVADKPVTATAVASRTSNSTDGQGGQIFGSLSNGGNGDFRGYMLPFRDLHTHPVTALPINCSSAPAAHFACSMTLEGNSSASPAGDVFVRPDARGQVAQPADRIQ